MLKQFHNPMSQKLMNTKLLYKLIRTNGPVTKNALIELTGLKQTTCGRIVEELIQEGLIIESGTDRSSGGRKPIMYDINSKLYYCIGIDISRTFTKVLLLDIHLKVKDEAKLRMDHTCSPEKTISFIINAIEKMLNKNQIEHTQLLGIGIGAIEPLDREKGIIFNPLYFPANNWRNIKISEILRNHFNTRILVDSGVNTAIRAEYEIGLNSVVGNLAYTIAGVGIRLGLMTDHQLFHSPATGFGKYGNGHMVVNTNGRKCDCGNYGCVQTYSSILALKEEIIHHLKRGHSSILTEKIANPDEIEFEDICWALKNDDQLCSFIVKDFGFYTGMGVANIINLFQPDIFILEGPMYSRLELFYETVTKTASERIGKIYPGYEVKFSHGYLGENAAAIGAGSMVLGYYID
ncbi:ROK family transcriptional regulator [Neobacillus mesonae]|uniref:ROK family transcriptional regulator n=1 Tax=Neobacillus mesonae TaxID=1193713 RepID=UPI002E1A909B|nr:ROK family transcriptional regulator [Neobacillus mesonae]